MEHIMSQDEINLLNEVYKYAYTVERNSSVGRVFLLSDRNANGYYNNILELYDERMIKYMADGDVKYAGISDIKSNIESTAISIIAPMMVGKYGRKYKVEIRIHTLSNKKKVLLAVYSVKGMPFLFSSGIIKNGSITLEGSMYNQRYIKYAQDCVNAFYRVSRR